jgi:hypothetical protein
VNAPQLIVFLVLATIGSQGIDPVPPPGIKYIPVTTIVEAEEEFPEYVIVSISWRWNFPPPRPPAKTVGKTADPPPLSKTRSMPVIELVTIAPGQPLTHKGSARVGRVIYAVPKGVLADYADLEKLGLALLNNDVAEARSHPFRSTREQNADDPRTEIVLHYRFQKAPDGSMEFLRTDPDPALYAGSAAGEVSRPRTQRSPLAMVGAVATACLILTGAWLMSRTRRATRIPTAPTAPTAPRREDSVW